LVGALAQAYHAVGSGGTAARARAQQTARGHPRDGGGGCNTFGVLILLTVRAVGENSIREHQAEAMLDAFGYLGDLFEARFYEPTDYAIHTTRSARRHLNGPTWRWMSIAKVESNFKPVQEPIDRAFQLSDHEFAWRWHLDARTTLALQGACFGSSRFKMGAYHPDYAERYMIHQQGIQGAIEHYTRPARVAWQSMCATDEGFRKGEQWCRKAIWRNLLPQWKRTFGSVEKISSGDFVSLWTERINELAKRFSGAE
jgi:hypothetical protein